MENVIVGVLNVARMLCVDPASPLGWAAKLFFVPFFCVHYGLFAAVHGAFVFGLFGSRAYQFTGLWPGEALVAAIRDFGLALPLAAIAASHLFSFFWNYLWRGEFRVASVPQLMTQPYRRVMVLHVVILAGGALTVALGSPVWMLLVLVLVKTGVDLYAHMKEH